MLPERLVLDLTFTDDVLRTCLDNGVDPVVTLVEDEIQAYFRRSNVEIEVKASMRELYVKVYESPNMIRRFTFDMPYSMTDLETRYTFGVYHLIQPFSVSIVSKLEGV